MAVGDLVQQVGAQIRFCVAASFSPADDGTNWTIGTPTDVALTLASLATNTGRQSAKVDLGASRAASYEVLGCVDFTDETPTQGYRVDYYWMPSTSGTAGTGNVVGNSGGDAAAPDGAVGSATLTDMIAMSTRIGSLIIHDGAAVQNGVVGVFSPSSRYGQLLLVNNSGDIFEADDVEMHQVFNPILDNMVQS
jgi:hypothetical protein